MKMISSIIFIIAFYLDSTQSSILSVEQKVEKAIKSINQILNFNKNPTFAANVPHTYDDKFHLVEYLVDVGLTSHLESLKLLGLTSEKILELSQLSQNKSILLQFSSVERCNFLREEKREVETGDKEVQEGVLFTTTKKRFKTISEYFWNFEVESSLLVCRKGGGHEYCETIARNKKVHLLKTAANKSPRPETYILPRIDLDATWFFRLLKHSDDFPSFRINRTDADCFTPVRNQQSSSALTYFDSVITWSDHIGIYYRNLMTGLEQLWQSPKDERGLEKLLSGIQIFIPVVPIMISDDRPVKNSPSTATSALEGDILEENRNDDISNNSKVDSSLFLNTGELAQLFMEEQRTIGQGFQLIDSYMSETQMAVLSSDHAKQLLLLRHLNGVGISLVSSVMSVEEMLERQLYSAIGREVTVDDVSEYMKLRNQQLFTPEYRPSPMTYAVRRSRHHSPEGSISLERELNGGRSSSSKTSSPVLHTVVSKEIMVQNPSNMSVELLNTRVVDPMSFALDDVSQITISGERYIHSYLHHQFSYQSSPSMALAFRARQFSSFVVLLGTISSSTTFEPLQAFILNNKDEMRIPLEMEFIPSLKEFRKAISSLSPEQKQFAEAIRELQMSSTLFGIVVIQIKPQLEKVLNLPEDSLTKEIELTEALLKLFIEYQIPSDLLSYDELSDGDYVADGSVANVTATTGSVVRSVEKVREHVKAIQTLIERVKEEELKVKKQEDDYHNRRTPTMTPSSLPMSCPTGGPSHVQNFASFAGVRREMRAAPGQPNILHKNIELGDTVEELAADSSTEADSSSTPHKFQSLNDLSALSNKLQNYFDQYSSSQSIRPGIIRTGPIWKKQHQENFFTPSREIQFNSEEQRKEKQRAFDLLDALTRSGGLTIDDATVHVILASSHYFPQSLLDTVIQKNLNPLIKLEETTLLMSRVIHNKEINELIVENEKKVIQSRHNIP